MRILVVRRDNIGDLICTTPLLTALRQKFPEAWIGAFVNTYNAPVLERNPHVSEIVAYTKLKHLGFANSIFAAMRDRFMLIRKLRQMHLDHVVLATPDFVPRIARLARWFRPKQVTGFSDGSARAGALDRSIRVDEVAGRHEVERVFALARLFGVATAIPPLTLVPDPAELAAARAAFGGTEPKIAVHISARRPAQRWPAERFAALIGRLQERHKVILLWSPGSAADVEHPGDDEKAKLIMSRVKNGARFIAYRTGRLQALIGALASCDAVICSDGGASHIAAALGKPMVCFFGDSPVERWRPWGVPLRLIQPGTKNVADISVEEALVAFASLAADTGVLRHPAP